MISCRLFFVILFFTGLVHLAEGSPPESRLMRDLLHGYVVEERPVIDSKQPVVVTLGLTLNQIIDMNEKEEQLEVNMWLRYGWKDENLRWDPGQYENVTDLRHPVGTIWTPDVLLYNSVDAAFDSTYKVNLLGYSDGAITWVPPGIFKISCKLDITYFPFDEQVCFFKFGSWSFSGVHIDLQPADFDFSEYMENGEWQVVKSWVNRSEKFYACCPEPYPDVKFYIQLRRRTLYYAFNLIMPCGLTMVLVMLGFTLSPDTCEKVGLQISVSLAICIFLTIVSEMTPKTSEAVPLLGIFFQSCFIVSAGATAFTVYVQSVHFRNQGTSKRMGFWSRYILLEWMPYLLCIKTPKAETSLSSLLKSYDDRKSTKANEKALKAAFTYEDGTCTVVNASPSEFQDNYEAIMIQLQSMVANEKADKTVLDRIKILDNIYKHVKMVREASDDTVEENTVKNEWQLAAMIVDRLGFILFALILTTTTLIIILKAPYLSA